MEFSTAELRYYLDKCKSMISLVYPVALTDKDRAGLKNLVQASSIKLIRSYFVSTRREDVIGKGVADIEEKIKVSEGKSLFGLLDQLAVAADEAEEEFLSTLTDEFVKGSPEYKDFMDEMALVYEDLKANLPTPPLSPSQSGPSRKVGEIPTIDPITKGPLKNPVKNIHCNHFYGKESIENLISGGRKTRCPVAGCSNPHYVILTQLVQDKEMAKLIKKKLKQRGVEQVQL